MELRTQLRRAAGYFACNEALVHGERRFSFAEAMRSLKGVWAVGLLFVAVFHSNVFHHLPLVG